MNRNIRVRGRQAPPMREQQLAFARIGGWQGYYAPTNTSIQLAFDNAQANKDYLEQRIQNFENYRLQKKREFQLLEIQRDHWKNKYQELRNRLCRNCKNKAR